MLLPLSRFLDLWYEPENCNCFRITEGNFKVIITIVVLTSLTIFGSHVDSIQFHVNSKALPPNVSRDLLIGQSLS